ncbi:Methylthioribose-1-phosphate isomerase [Methylophaga frappieri]|uniref:Methylthioribose-1-phosphate isomerase n=1 Tax=Methylophaga frappieri (strain ATCC BAA-2434 / DSM 25690 / JAM7) TaxID=754477 RepID=I1YGV9_METFJ|nr:S-methyl-5-thioribose-1-phosphate isomerase [Methylophaga frappieri]AFJ02152.1 Methylthioribose-1-phosphate isomerase [Methylophaga frappieri]
MSELNSSIQPLRWQAGKLVMLDQRRLPLEQVWLEFESCGDVALAIRQMVVRGAPAIGIAAAYAVVLASRYAWAKKGTIWKQAMTRPLRDLAVSRPTAVNLQWAINHMQRRIDALPNNQQPEAVLLDAAKAIHDADITDNKTMGRLGAELIQPGSTVLTHCNAGALATGGFGTALGVIRQAHSEGKISRVYVDETRPWLQGARLTAWELMRDHIPCVLQADLAAAALLATGKVDWIIVGADRIAANGDVANKIGTYGLAVLAQYHQVKMMVVAPTATIDWQCESGSRIPIEQRERREVTHIGQHRHAPYEVEISNPAFDVTPAELITAIVTETGVVKSPSAVTMQSLRERRNTI